MQMIFSCDCLCRGFIWSFGQRQEEEKAEQQRQHVDERNEEPGDAPLRQANHVGFSPPSERMMSRPNNTTQLGKMLMRAMNKPLPVAVSAGAYNWMICAGGVGPLIELNVCKMPATVPISPKSGNHSAA